MAVVVLSVLCFIILRLTLVTSFFTVPIMRNGVGIQPHPLDDAITTTITTTTIFGGDGDDGRDRDLHWSGSARSSSSSLAAKSMWAPPPQEDGLYYDVTEREQDQNLEEASSRRILERVDGLLLTIYHWNDGPPKLVSPTTSDRTALDTMWDDIMKVMNRRHRADFDTAYLSSPLAVEGLEDNDGDWVGSTPSPSSSHNDDDYGDDDVGVPSYEWIVVEDAMMDASTTTTTTTTIMEESNDDNGFAAHDPPSSRNKLYKLAIQSIGVPILNQTAVNIIRHAADLYWNHRDETQEGRSSRFTYQRRGNSEVHLSDLARTSSTVRHVANHALRSKIYPLIRQSLWPDNNNDNDKKPQGESGNIQSHLYVYDALVIRYNATEAMATAAVKPAKSTTGTASRHRGGAGQPYHRDYGIVSVNIMLNDPSEFSGGGTFFENQLRQQKMTTTTTALSSKRIDGGTTTDDDFPTITEETGHHHHHHHHHHCSSVTAANKPLIPNGGVGHCLAHYSSERHAGSATTGGVRDVLVFFVSAVSLCNESLERNIGDAIPSPPTPPRPPPPLPPPIPIQGAYLKHQARDTFGTNIQEEDAKMQQIPSTGGELPNRRSPKDAILTRILHHRMAVGVSPHYSDGEAWLYLGTALMDYTDLVLAEEGRPDRRYDDEVDDDDDDHVDNGNVSYETILMTSKQCLDCAARLIPCDSRVFNNLALVYKRLANHHVTISHREDDDGHGYIDDDATTNDQNWVSEAERCHRRACDILQQSEEAGVDVGREYDAARLNYGLHLSWQDRFQDACTILEPVAGKGGTTPMNNGAGPIVNDAYKLWKFCSRQESLQQSP